MPNTITSYVTFVAGTKAKSSEANGNFSNHRGTLLPINENTATASNYDHDLGASDHFWNNAYIGSFVSELTTTGQFQFGADTGGSAVLSISAATGKFRTARLALSNTTGVDYLYFTASAVGNSEAVPATLFQIMNPNGTDIEFCRPMQVTATSVQTNSFSAAAVTSGAYSITLFSRGINRIALKGSGTDARIATNAVNGPAVAGVTLSADCYMLISLNRVEAGVTSTIARFPFRSLRTELLDAIAGTLASIRISNRFPLTSVNYIDTGADRNTNVTYELNISASGTGFDSATVKDAQLEVITGL